MTIEGSSKPWCGKFDHAIDYQLVKIEKPECIERYNGCGNCPEQYQKKETRIENNFIMLNIGGKKMEKMLVVKYRLVYEAACNKSVDFGKEKFNAYPADEVADLAGRVLDAFCAYEPFRIMAQLTGKKMPKIFDSMYMENLIEELEQIAGK